jgi:Uma2 family endonuclease
MISTHRAIVERVLLPNFFPAEHTMAMPAIERRWTAADVRELTREDQPWPRYELIDGELFVTPAPRDAHEHAITELLLLLYPYVAQREFGVVKQSPCDIPIKDETIVQPDLFVVPVRQRADGTRLRWPETLYMLLVVEVLSPSSLRTDRVTKRDLYLDHGVAEYWIVDLDAEVIERWTPSQNSPQLLRDAITWTPLGDDGLTIDLSAYFKRVVTQNRLFQQWREKK